MLHSTSPAELLRSRRAPSAVAVFESMISGPPSDGPLAVAAELARRDAGLELVWAGRRDGWSSLPWPSFRYVEHGSAAHRAVAARALVTVTGHGAPRFLNRDAIHVQVGHGIPLKRLGRGNPSLDDAVISAARRRARKWSVYPSPSPFYDHYALDDMFVDPASIVRTPYPRYDRMRDFQGHRSAIRARLGVAEDEPFVLYAPTYRAAHDGGDFNPLSTLPELAATISGTARLGVRGHYLGAFVDSAGGPTVGAGDTVVTDSTELVTACDVVVTDYSSMAVDAIVADVPVVVLAPDIETYAQRPGIAADLPSVFGTAFTTGVAECVEAVRSVLADRHGFLEQQRPWITELLGDNAVPGNGAAALVDLVQKRLAG